MTDRCLTRNPRAAWRIYDGEAVIVSPDDSMLHTLNRAGTIVWEAADGIRPPAAIAARVARAFDLPAERVEAEVLGFIAELEARRLLVDSDPPAPGPLRPSVDAPARPAHGRTLPPTAYQAPRVMTEAIFETTALACGKIPAGGQRCNVRPKSS